MNSIYIKLFNSALALTLIFSVLFGCTVFGSKATGVAINGTNIDNEVFIYYLNEVISESDETISEDEIKVQAAEKCAKYVAVNSEFAKRDLSLSIAQKTELKNDIHVLWPLYQNYYEKIGVSKETYVKIKQSEAFKEALRTAIFDVGGEREVSKELIQEYFEENYIAFQAINGYFTAIDENGATIRLSENQISELIEKFKETAKNINDGASIADEKILLSADRPEAEQAITTVFIRKDNTNYPEGFFEQVIEREYGKAFTLVFEDYIYIIIREDVMSEEYSYFQEYRNTCFKTLTESDLEDEIYLWASKFSSILDDSVADEIYKKVFRALN